MLELTNERTTHAWTWPMTLLLEPDQWESISSTWPIREPLMLEPDQWEKSCYLSLMVVLPTSTNERRAGTWVLPTREELLYLSLMVVLPTSTASSLLGWLGTPCWVLTWLHVRFVRATFFSNTDTQIHIVFGTGTVPAYHQFMWPWKTTLQKYFLRAPNLQWVEITFLLSEMIIYID